MESPALATTAYRFIRPVGPSSLNIAVAVLSSVPFW
jgi:hypothetical protein